MGIQIAVCRTGSRGLGGRVSCRGRWDHHHSCVRGGPPALEGRSVVMDIKRASRKTRSKRMVGRVKALREDEEQDQEGRDRRVG
jgi:hypothetical protein